MLNDAMEGCEPSRFGVCSPNLGIYNFWVVGISTCWYFAQFSSVDRDLGEAFIVEN